ncbi:MAG TPA: hypothetical protein VIG97_02320 [Luteimonas sp.]
MKTINVRLSKFQREELSYKLDIMAEGFDAAGNVQAGYMAESYGFNRAEELAAMQAKVDESPKALTRIVTLDEREARAAWGEFENHYQIAFDNRGCYDGKEEQDRRRAEERYKQAMDRIAEAAAAAGFDAKAKAVAA